MSDILSRLIHFTPPLSVAQGHKLVRIDFDTSAGDETYTTLKSSLEMAKQLTKLLADNIIVGKEGDFFAEDLRILVGAGDLRILQVLNIFCFKVLSRVVRGDMEEYRLMDCRRTSQARFECTILGNVQTSRALVSVLAIEQSSGPCWREVFPSVVSSIFRGISALRRLLSKAPWFVNDGSW